jgi:hypothetical protein
MPNGLRNETCLRAQLRTGATLPPDQEPNVNLNNCSIVVKKNGSPRLGPVFLSGVD